MDLTNAQMMEHIKMIAIRCIWDTVSGTVKIYNEILIRSCNCSERIIFIQSESKCC